MKKWFVNRVFPSLLGGVFDLWSRTLRVRNLGSREAEVGDQGFILTLWHGHIFYFFHHWRNHNISLLISPSKDGDFLANLARRMGYSVVRGSTYKSPISAGRSLIKILRKNQGIIVVADGSRGPRHKAQAGALQLAGITGASVIPMAYGARRKIEFNSWDRFILPLPFTRITLNFGVPIRVPRNADDRVIKKKQAELEESLQRIDRETAERL